MALLLLLSGVRGGGESGLSLPLPLLTGAGLPGRVVLAAVTSTAVLPSCAIFFNSSRSLLRWTARSSRPTNTRDAV